LSQLRRAASPSSGKPEKLSWAEFVQHVLGLTIKAYQAMRRDRVAEHHWEENVFTERLGHDYIRTIAFDEESPVRVTIRAKIHTEQMRKGKQPTIEAKEIDLQMSDVWERDYHKKHFVWEAKRVGDKRVDSQYSSLNSEYVHEAIYRFIKREYADTLSDAGILGYVLGGNAGNIVGDINLCMGRIRKNPPLPASNHLQMAHPIDNFEDVYCSHHTRTDNTNICLHHLFLTFEFI
jgi:hypothetical protein